MSLASNLARRSLSETFVDRNYVLLTLKAIALSTDTDLTISDTTVGHNGISEFDFSQTRPFQISTSQVNVPKDTASQISSTQIGSK